MSENLLVTHCSPTLAGMKTGSLFNCQCGCQKQLRDVISRWNKMLNPKGVFIRVMRFEKQRALIYVYRRVKLEKTISCKEISAFLETHGYDCRSLDGMLDRLSQRLCKRDEFPHEVGVFLGYPFEDVKGFIQNKGKSYKHVGHWKVYSDESAARQLFSKYKKCTDVYCRQLEEGTDLIRLTVEGKHLT